MTIKATLREQVRQRAHFVCEFCDISEIDTGGQLTIDHFQPQGKGGDDKHRLGMLCACALYGLLRQGKKIPISSRRIRLNRSEN